MSGPPNPRRRAVLAAAAAFAAALAGGCAREPFPARLRIGVLPDTTPAELRSRHGPLIAHLQSRLGIPCELAIPAGYDELIAEFAAGRIELAFFGGYSYVMARDQARADPLVMRDVDLHFTSYFLAPARHKGRPLESFRGARLTFGPRLSTSGHLMARARLEERGIRAEEFFSDVGYSASHTRTAFLVRDGKVDLGAANSLVIDAMLRRGELRHDQIAIVWETPPYPDYVWAAQAGMAPALRHRLRDAFLELSLADPAHAAVLAAQQAAAFMPARPENLQELVEPVRKLSGENQRGRA